MVRTAELMARPAGRAIGLAVLIGAFLVACQAGRQAHDDRAGPLSATSGQGSFAMHKPSGVGQTWHGGFGSYKLCVHEHGVQIELQKVGWRVATDAPPLQVETRLRIVDRTTKPTTEFIAVDGLPWKPYTTEPYPGTYSDEIAGRKVTQLCSDLKQEHEGRPNQPEFTELVFVMKVGEQGGEVAEGYVDYVADGEPYRLVIRWKMIMCGTAIESRGDDDCKSAGTSN